MPNGASSLFVPALIGNLGTSAMQALSAGYFGVASERSGDESVCASTLASAGYRHRAGSSEDSAIPSDKNYNRAVVKSDWAPCSAAIRIFYREGRADMQREFRADIEFSSDWRAVWEACKNVPNGCGVEGRF
jgi:hypothetical protein